MNKIFFNKDQIILGILGAVLILFGIFHFGDKQFQKTRAAIARTNNLIASQQIELENIQGKIKQLEEVNKTELDNLKIELSQEKEKRADAEEARRKETEIAQKQLANLEEKMAETEKSDLTAIVQQWEPYIVAVECDFYSPETGELFIQTSGSGLLTKWKNTSAAILTNKHIVTPLSLNLGNIADRCLIKFPQKDIFVTSDNISVLTDEFDWGLITIDFQNEYIGELMQTPPYLCVAGPVLGDEVAILGYPNIGDETNVTVTDGIISGFDDNYFITSAKVEKGNSGGAAVSLKNNCYLGTPTFATTGEIESLARILDVKVLFK
ncbi:MAG: trypsin-like peptidase domain-containing protein [Candidatus Pacebacteria bacterium]|nr:trypsin-like peptidase domain-containing protein [Candidatus Paceibacterota bacterium]